MTNKPTFLTAREIGLCRLAIMKCDVLADMGVLPRPWATDHSPEETERVVTKLNTMQDEADARELTGGLVEVPVSELLHELRALNEHLGQLKFREYVRDKSGRFAKKE